MKIGSIESALPVQSANLTLGNNTNNTQTKSQIDEAKPALETRSVNDNKPVANVSSEQEKKLQELSDKMVGKNESLVIEKDPNSAGFIYKTVNKATGEVVRIWPEATFLDNASSISDVDTRGIVMDSLV
ncbi:flagellar protein FlaG [Pseudaquidulcibacter saccharophilus]|uniref:flagellar protein FlaG n=1 Tax=Pseudaquidulcibacter saccharophilus TaxID=2831900 RepID=UPI001EFF4732|nr:flagellar protein FlaG [Pseudaquidulcibacter saccharophilus]